MLRSSPGRSLGEVGGGITRAFTTLWRADLEKDIVIPTTAIDLRGSMTNSMKLLLVGVLAALFVVMLSGAARAQEVPETIADLQSVERGVVDASSRLIDYLAVTWNAPESAIDEAELRIGSVEPNGAVRFRHSGMWGEWIAFFEDGAQAPGEWGSSLVHADRAEAYEVRGIPDWASDPQVFVINTTDGPPVAGTGQLLGTSSEEAACLSRAEWGADESVRFDEDGTELWPTSFYPTQGIIVHHAGSNDSSDPAALVRAIYAFHTAGRGWGDIAYHYLIDSSGRVYEGRWSGTTRTPCSAGGDGSDFAHNDTGVLVRGGHTKYHNAGNVGVALLGNYATAEENHDPGWVQAYPTADMLTDLKSLLVDLSARHGLDPSGQFGYVNPRCGALEDTPYWDCSDTSLYIAGTIRNVISGHRDWRPTSCPGAVLYSLLPEIRTAIDGKYKVAIDGAVTDLWGFPIAGAAISSDTGPSASTVTDGTYDLGGIEVGNRRIEASASGFVSAGTDLFVGSSGATVDLKLESLIDRLWGADRYGTSVAISEASFAPGVPVVYVAVGTGFADALSVAPVGGVEGAPVLLTRTGSLPGVVARELDRLDPDRIVVVGGPAVLSNVVIQQLGPYLP
jgi:hypothetical protein